MKIGVVECMKEQLKHRQFVSREEIAQTLKDRPGFTVPLLEGALLRLQNEGVIVSAHDNHHFFFV